MNTEQYPDRQETRLEDTSNALGNLVVQSPARRFSQATIEFWEKTGQLDRRPDLRQMVEEQADQPFTRETE